MKDPQVYLRFLNLLHTLEGAGQMPDIDADSRKLLELIALKHNQQNPLTISEAMALGHIASPATIHRKLDVLRESGMIYSAYEAGNRRTKFLRPTDQAYDYFNTLGSFIGQASVMTN